MLKLLRERVLFTKSVCVDENLQSDKASGKGRPPSNNAIRIRLIKMWIRQNFDRVFIIDDNNVDLRWTSVSANNSAEEILEIILG